MLTKAVIIVALTLVVGLISGVTVLAYRYHNLSMAQHRAVAEQLRKQADTLWEMHEKDAEFKRQEDRFGTLDSFDLIDWMCENGELSDCPDGTNRGSDRKVQ